MAFRGILSLSEMGSQGRLSGNFLLFLSEYCPMADWINMFSNMMQAVLACVQTLKHARQIFLIISLYEWLKICKASDTIFCWSSCRCIYLIRLKSIDNHIPRKIEEFTTHKRPTKKTNVGSHIWIMGCTRIINCHRNNMVFCCNCTLLFYLLEKQLNHRPGWLIESAHFSFLFLLWISLIQMCLYMSLTRGLYEIVIESWDMYHTVSFDVCFSVFLEISTFFDCIEKRKWSLTKLNSTFFF